MIDGSVVGQQTVRNSHNFITIDKTPGVARTKGENSKADATDSVEIALTESAITITDRPASISPPHWDEWVVESCVAPAIAAKAIRSVGCEYLTDTDIKKRLNRKSKAAWMKAGYLIQGVQPMTGERNDSYQFKPDNPPAKQKYITPSRADDLDPSESASRVTFLPGCDWLSVAMDASRAICITEGAKKAGAAITAGLPTMSLPGVANGQLKGRLSDDLKPFTQPGRRIYLAFDMDLLVKRQVFAALRTLTGLLLEHGVNVSILIWDEKHKGLDDWLASLPPGDRSSALQDAIASAPTWQEFKADRDQAKADEPEAEKESRTKLSHSQIAFRELYGDANWIAIDGEFYLWQGTHYEKQDPAIERSRIAKWCDSFCSDDGEDITFPYANPSSIRKVESWALGLLSVPASSCNPPGVNCLNGVLEFTWGGHEPTWKLVKHDPTRHYFTYAPLANFDPNADPTHCDRLLDALDAPQREIFLRTIAAAIDLPSVRKRWGRMVRALLLRGDGANGKDSLRECVSLLFGKHGLTNASLGDFAEYDSGRKFPLAKLERSRVNWSSENASFNKLDGLQSLKATITGDPISIEGKGRDEREHEPACILAFNINEIPNVLGAGDAIASRYAILEFSKCFKDRPDPANPAELQADSRFKYDMDFVRGEVLPAFLNRVLVALRSLMSEGIDYAVTDRTMQSTQQANNHLSQFCADIGLRYAPGEMTPVQVVWDKLATWYSLEGWLDDAGKLTDLRPGDKALRTKNQLRSRLKEIFPKMGDRTRCQDRTHSLYNLRVLEGLAFAESAPASALHPHCIRTASALASAPQEPTNTLPGNASVDSASAASAPFPTLKKKNIEDHKKQTSKSRFAHDDVPENDVNRNQSHFFPLSADAESPQTIGPKGSSHSRGADAGADAVRMQCGCSADAGADSDSLSWQAEYMKHSKIQTLPDEKLSEELDKVIEYHLDGHASSFKTFVAQNRDWLKIQLANNTLCAEYVELIKSVCPALFAN